MKVKEYLHQPVYSLSGYNPLLFIPVDKLERTIFQIRITFVFTSI